MSNLHLCPLPFFSPFLQLHVNLYLCNVLKVVVHPWLLLCDLSVPFKDYRYTAETLGGTMNVLGKISQQKSAQMGNLFSIASVASILSTTFQAQGLLFPGMLAKVNGRLTVLGLVGLGSMISMLILVSPLRSSV